MHQLLSGLTLYSDLGPDSILWRVADVLRHAGQPGADRVALAGETRAQVRRLLELATACGFDRNLWQDYLAWLLATNENPFSLVCERAGAPVGSVNALARQDFAVFHALFHYDFRPAEEALGMDAFSILSDYHAVAKPARIVNRGVSANIRSFSDALAAAQTVQQFMDTVTGFYRDIGVGALGLNRAFRLQADGDALELQPIQNLDAVRLDDLVGYELQKQELIANTEAFLQGQRANNMLLYGDSGTGKSTSVKALPGEYYGRGLRIIELYKHQFEHLSALLALIKGRNYRFILYLDDLSFEEFEIEYKHLKAVIEGGLETRPDNVLIYATSNRRHLIRETWSDRSDMEHSEDVHRSDTMEEKLSLFHRFGVAIHYGKPSRTDYLHIVAELAQRAGVDLPEQELAQKAGQWEMRHGGLSGRTAQQFINSIRR